MTAFLCLVPLPTTPPPPSPHRPRKRAPYRPTPSPPHIPASATATTRTTTTMHPMSTVRLLPAAAVLAAILLAACAAPFAGPAAPDPARLLQPDHPEMQRTAPDTFEVHFETTQGDFVMEVVREWAPIGADRFYNLARHGYYDGVRFFRVLPGFVVQFGISGDPAISAAWRPMRMADDPVVQSNERGYVSYAMAGPDTRTVQVFINLATTHGSMRRASRRSRGS
jgi:cyclophilin family peptidyl-prolyl cis-trans isomerase